MIQDAFRLKVFFFQFDKENLYLRTYKKLF